MRYAADHKEQTRKRVLTEAAKEIRTKGPDRIGVAGVMKRAGLTHGGFYAHFRSKDALVAAAIETMFEGVRRRWAVETDGKDAAVGLASYIDFYLSPAHRDAVATGCPVAALATELHRLPAASRAAFATGTRWLRVPGTP